MPSSEIWQNTSRDVLAACETARTPRQYAERVVRQTARATGSPFCCWRDAHGQVVAASASGCAPEDSVTSGVLTAGGREGGYSGEHIRMLEEIGRMAVLRYEYLVGAQELGLPDPFAELIHAL